METLLKKIMKQDLFNADNYQISSNFWGFDDWPETSWTAFVDYPQHKWETKEGKLILKVLLPGAKKGDIDLKLIRNDYLCLEYKGDVFAKFSRRWYIHDGIDTEKITSKYEDGVLIVTLPHKKELEKSICIE